MNYFSDCERTELRGMIQACIRTDGPFVLSSGASSHYKIDCNRAVYTADSLRLIVAAFLHEIDALPNQPEIVAGISTGADLIVGGLLTAWRSTISNPALGGCRAMKKGQGWHVTPEIVIVNPPPRGSHVVIIDDVLTTGQSINMTAHRLDELGCGVVGIIALIDRQEGGVEMLEDRGGCPVRAIFKKSDFDIPVESSR